MLIGAYAYFWYEPPWLYRVAGNDPPILGEYDNVSNSEIVLQQMHYMKAAGIDFVAISWDPKKDYSYVLEAADRAGIMVTCFYETLIRASARNRIVDSDAEIIAKDIEKIYEDTTEDCWLRMDNKPVIMMYVTRCLQSALAIRLIRQKLDSVYLVGDELFWKSARPDRLVLFDAVTSYNMYDASKIHGNSDEEICQNYLNACDRMEILNKKACHEAGVPIWTNAMPGYDDTGYRPQEKHPIIPRLGGEFFRQTLVRSFHCHPPCLLITSWNEFYEKTHIEPTRSDGRLYLDILKEAKCSLGK